jgi:hypothetical protein
MPRRLRSANTCRHWLLEGVPGSSARNTILFDTLNTLVCDAASDHGADGVNSFM